MVNRRKFIKKRSLFINGALCNPVSCFIQELKAVKACMDTNGLHFQIDARYGMEVSISGSGFGCMVYQTTEDRFQLSWIKTAITMQEVKD